LAFVSTVLSKQLCQLPSRVFQTSRDNLFPPIAWAGEGEKFAGINHSSANGMIPLFPRLKAAQNRTASA
jgi:hypothetical protein